MSTDLVRKLRVMGQNYHSTYTIFEVAADEIERLYKRIEELESLEAVKPGTLFV